MGSNGWRGPQKNGDPRYKTRSWKVKIRRHWIELGLPCSICQVQITYQLPSKYPDGRYRRTSLVVDHYPISVEQGKRLGMSDAEIFALENTRPICRSCSNRQGAKIGQAKKSSGYRNPVPLAKPQMQAPQHELRIIKEEKLYAIVCGVQCAIEADHDRVLREIAAGTIKPRW